MDHGIRLNIFNIGKYCMVPQITKLIGFKSIMVHGVKENIVLFTYQLLPIVLIGFAILNGKI